MSAPDAEDNVVILYEANATDVPAMLRRLASKIELREADVEACTLVACGPDGSYSLYGFGEGVTASTSLAHVTVAQAMFVDMLRSDT